MVYPANPSTNLETLPFEILLIIGEHLPFAALQYLGATCVTLRMALHQVISVRRLAAKNRLAELARDSIRGLVFHNTLLGIVRQEYDVYNISMLFSWYEISGEPMAPSELKEALNITTHEEVRLREMSFNCLWLGHDLCSRIWEHFWPGSNDAALCLLVLILPRLGIFSVPCDAPLLEATFTAVARQYHASSVSRTSNPSLPLRELYILQTSMDPQYIGTQLDTVAVYSTIPSIRRIIVEACRSDCFSGWPAGLCSKATEIYLTYSTVSEKAIRAFASGLQGPCVVRMDYDSYGGDFPADDGLTWDHYTIDFENGVRREKIELRYQEALEWQDFRTLSPGSDCSVGMNRLRKGGRLWELD